MNKRQFHDALRILCCAGRNEVSWMTDLQWANFHNDPYDFIIQCNDDDYGRIWSMIERCQPKVYAHEGLVVALEDAVRFLEPLEDAGQLPRGMATLNKYRAALAAARETAP